MEILILTAKFSMPFRKEKEVPLEDRLQNESIVVHEELNHQ